MYHLDIFVVLSLRELRKQLLKQFSVSVVQLRNLAEKYYLAEKMQTAFLYLKQMLWALSSLPPVSCPMKGSKLMSEEIPF